METTYFNGGGFPANNSDTQTEYRYHYKFAPGESWEYLAAKIRNWRWRENAAKQSQNSQPPARYLHMGC
jgi:hypothetical protein